MTGTGLGSTAMGEYGKCGTYAPVLVHAAKGSPLAPSPSVN
ncbi:hypothetical protein [Mycobacterium tuberculosis]|nr:hypothetical protein [Mycobacterium tuberculosis]